MDKRVIKNKKGFTLIELLAVIVILGVMLAISVVAVNKIRNNQEEENKINVISGILTGAKRYVTEDKSILDNLPATIIVSEIKNQDYADFDEIKYKNFMNKNVMVETCQDNSTKLKYSFEGYNDCGCEEQQAGVANEICTN